MFLFSDEPMFTLTVFANVKPNVLAEKLSSVRFKINQKDGGIYWKGEDGFFYIVPFRNQSIQVAKGYRVYSNYPITTIIYLLEGSFNWVEYKVSGIEYQNPYSKSKLRLIQEFNSHPILTTVDTRGLFLHNNVIVVVMDKKVVLQRRGKIRNIGNELRKIEEVRDKLFPETYDLFSLLEKENVG